MPISKPNNLLPSIKNISQSLNGHSSHNFKKPQAQIPNHLHQQAFDNSLQPNIISVVSNGKILAVNHAAGKLLGYSGKELLSKKFDELFTPSNGHFKQVLKQRGAMGHTSGDLTVIKKNGKQLPCQITSVVFTGDNHIQKAITTLVDRSEDLRRQSAIDMKKKKEVAAEITFEHFKSDATLARLHNLEHKLDE